MSNTRVDLSNPRGEPWISYSVAEYEQQDPLLQPGSAATGVVAYRDGAIPQLTNWVLWGDFPSGEVFHLPTDALRDGGQAAIRRALFPDGTSLESVSASSVLHFKVDPEPRAEARSPNLRATRGPTSQGQLPAPGGTRHCGQRGQRAEWRYRWPAPARRAA